MLFLRTAVLLGMLASLVQADTLRLRDGTVITGNYVGGSQNEIWFQRGPAGAEAFPLFMVESVRFGNLIGSSAPNLPKPTASKARMPVRKIEKPVTLATMFHVDRTQPIYLSRIISARLSP
ncbi:MAG TPA: hypothetical protein VGN17_00035 [Bryobacteraceae bacterium]|jgi:hypothetical protein